MADLFAQDGRALPFTLPEIEGYAASWNEQKGGFDIVVPGGTLYYAERFFNKAWCDRTFAFLQENDTLDWSVTDWRAVSAAELDLIAFRNICWKQDSLKLYGKTIPLPRLTAWYGNPGAAYTYSGIKSEPLGWNEGLLHLRRRVEEAAGATFNSVLLNWYRDERDSLSWHADDERELGRDPVIASANFGATRDFQLRRNSDRDQKITMSLGDGALLVMGGSLQHHWQHQAPKPPKRRGPVGSRFNLTFRTIHG